MLARLIASIFAGEIGDVVNRARVAAVFYVIAGLAALCGLGFFVGAGYVAAAEEWGSFWASIYFGIGFFVLALIIVLWKKITLRVRRRRAARRRVTDLRALTGTAALVLLPTLLSRKGAALGLLGPIAAAVGYAIYRENSGGADDGEDEGL